VIGVHGLVCLFLARLQSLTPPWSTKAGTATLSLIESAWYAFDDEGSYEKEDQWTLVELSMCALSAAIREKPQWYTKSRDTKAQEKWRMEIGQQQQGLHDSLMLISNMVRVVLAFAMVTAQSEK
jgi:hypothetical protein